MFTTMPPIEKRDDEQAMILKLTKMGVETQQDGSIMGYGAIDKATLSNLELSAQALQRGSRVVNMLMKGSSADRYIIN